jgi:hypothetical protein
METPVTLRYYTPSRVIPALLLYIVTVGLPILLAYGITWVRVLGGGDRALFGALEPLNGMAWMVLAIPVGVILLIRFGRQLIYDHPVFNVIVEKGRGKRVKVTDSEPENPSAVKRKGFGELGKLLFWMIFAFLFILVGSVLAIML